MLRIFTIILVAIVVALAGFSTQAQQIVPDIFFSEVLMGSITALVGGGIGTVVGIVSSIVICALNCSYGEVSLGFFAIAGCAVGATLGVISVATPHGIEGNPWLALVGALAGESLLAISLTAIAAVRSVTVYSLISPSVVVLGIPVIAALGATIGYNWGAKMKSDKSKPAALNWSLPLVAMKF